MIYIGNHFLNCKCSFIYNSAFFVSVPVLFLYIYMIRGNEKNYSKGLILKKIM